MSRFSLTRVWVPSFRVLCLRGLAMPSPSFYLGVASNLCALVSLVLVVMALYFGVWSGAEVTMPEYPGEKAPTSRIDFGLYECTSYFFDDKHGHSTQYAKLKQSNDVKVLRFTGIGVSVLASLSISCSAGLLLIYCTRAIFIQIWSLQERVMPTKKEDLVLSILAFTGAVAGTVGLALWAIAGYRATLKIRQSMAQIPLPIVSITPEFGISYFLDSASVFVSIACATLQATIGCLNQARREMGIAGGIILDYDSFGHRNAPCAPDPL
ncbi:hypothetical protein AAMO2058_000724300 [Amorphochlora amoebiformis]